MSILFVLLTFLVIISMNYLYFRTAQSVPVTARPPVRPSVPVMAKEMGFSIPKGYSFHPGHTWVMPEGGDNARVGLDEFAADIVGKIEQIEVVGAGRWVRQGQRLIGLKAAGTSFDLVSPVEGVVTDINPDVMKDPALAISDPYNKGWIAMVKAPDLNINKKNLLQGSMVAPWMHYNVSRLNSAITSSNPALAQDGGMPLNQVLLKVGVELRQKLIKDFFLN
jgi:glycine cleavage system H lipoate-binding protein